MTVVLDHNLCKRNKRKGEKKKKAFKIWGPSSQKRRSLSVSASHWKNLSPEKQELFELHSGSNKEPSHAKSAKQYINRLHLMLGLIL